MIHKIAISPCSGLSPNGLITRVACDDLSKENPQVLAICIGATAGDRVGFDKLIQKYPLITVNGCNNNCPNKILKGKVVEPVDTIIVNDELLKTDYFPNDTSRLDEEGEKCVEIIKEIIEKKINKQNDNIIPKKMK